MMKLAAFFVTSLLATPAFATWIAPVSTGACTRDFNPWGQASICECPHATRYENRIGACVQGAAIDVVVDGHITPVRSLEDDAVTFVLSDAKSEKSYTVVLPLELRSKFEVKEFAAVKFRVSGEVIENYDGTPIEQPTIILDRLDLWEVVADLDPITGEEIIEAVNTK